jgi:2-keto-3-deoxy-L-rhamnonate aldolase RhmA
MTMIRLSGMAPERAFWVMTANEDACQIAALLGYGTALIDMEHGTFDVASAARMTTLCKALRLRVLTRVESADRVPVQHALDSGSDGVVLPQIADLEHARRAAGYAKFPPLGTRGFGGGRTVQYVAAPEHFVEAENRRVKCWAMIETVRALEEVEAIAALDTVDGLFIGPNDLSLARGRGEYRADGRDHDDILAIARAAGSFGKPWAMPIATAADRRFAAQQGIDFIAITDDLTALHDGLELALRRMEA